MLRRAGALLSRRPAAAHCGLPHHPSPSFLLKGPLPVPHLGIGARGYARMARRLPPARPDGYSTSDVEADEPDLRAVEEEPRACAVGEEDGEDSEGSEMEGFMLEYGSGSDADGGDDEEEGAEERDRQL